METNKQGMAALAEFFKIFGKCMTSAKYARRVYADVCQ